MMELNSSNVEEEQEVVGVKLWLTMGALHGLQVSWACGPYALAEFTLVLATLITAALLSLTLRTMFSWIVVDKQLAD
jgi:hypothetical protein